MGGQTGAIFVCEFDHRKSRGGFGCGLALLFIRYRDELMSFIVTGIAGRAGRTRSGSIFMIFTACRWTIPGTLQRVFRPLAFALFAMVVSTVAVYFLHGERRE